MEAAVDTRFEMSTETIEQSGERSLRGPMGWWQRGTEFLTEVRNEMKRVTWPSQREVYATTVVVILTSVFFGLYLFGVDLLIGRGVEWILRRFGAA
jgi:preprotein translocase subunit SecE